MTPQPPPEPPADRVSTVARLVRESWAVVAPHEDEVAQLFCGILFSLNPDLRELFPIHLREVGYHMVHSIVRYLQVMDRQDEAMPLLRQMGRDHRKFGVIAGQYETVGTALLGAIKRYAGTTWTVEVELAWAEAYTIMAQAMLDAAAKDDGPAWWPAEVIEHERLGWGLARVRVRPDYPLPYRAGQYVSVEVPQRPRLWRHLSPANAPRDDGVIEFHVRAVDNGWVSRAIVRHTEVGQLWRLGPAQGEMSVDRTSRRPVLMVAGGTGVAPMLSIIENLAQFGDNPRVQLFYGGRTPDDLYALDLLGQLASVNPWLTVVPVVEQHLGAVDAEQGTLADAVTRYGSWSDRNVLVSGSPAMIRATVSRMLVAGTPLERIHYDPFNTD
ncbi:MAG TPA: FAD-binding oxidoreductase [Pseudonocardiaceae bacterium]